MTEQRRSDLLLLSGEFGSAQAILERSRFSSYSRLALLSATVGQELCSAALSSEAVPLVEIQLREAWALIQTRTASEWPAIGRYFSEVFGELLEPSDEARKRLARRHVEAELGAGIPCTSPPIISLTGELKTLTETVPSQVDAARLVRQMLAHVEFVVRYESPTKVKSFSSPHVPSTVFIAHDDGLRVDTATSLVFHEAVHCRLNQLSDTESLFRPAAWATSSTVNPSWHAVSVQWPVDRAFAALHYYVHMAVFSLLSDDPRSRAQAAARANELFDALVSSGRECLTPVGRRLLGWLGAALVEGDATSATRQTPYNLAAPRKHDPVIPAIDLSDHRVPSQFLMSFRPETAVAVVANVETGSLKRLDPVSAAVLESCGDPIGLVDEHEQDTGNLLDQATEGHVEMLLKAGYLKRRAKSDRA